VSFYCHKNYLISYEQNPPLEDCEQELKTVYRQLSGLLSSQDKKDVPLLIIALDEVDALTRERVQYLPSRIIGQVIRSYSTAKVDGAKACVVFISTNSRIEDFAPPALLGKFWTGLLLILVSLYVTDRSARVVKGDKLLFAPFSQLQWDVYAKPKSMLHLLSVGSYDDVISFGRPL
jgi:hypothetical protein